jgi:hypothetical protein
LIPEQGVGVPAHDVLDQPQSRVPSHAVAELICEQAVGVPVHDELDQEQS